MALRRPHTAVRMSRKGSLARAIRELEAGVKAPYEGIMYEGRKPVEGEWVNGIRAPDARALLELLHKTGIAG